MTNKASSAKQLSYLLNNIVAVPEQADRLISGLAQDSRLVKPGDLFFARSGTQKDGREFVAAAIKQGAVAVLVEEQETASKVNDETTVVPIFPVKDLAKLIGVIAARFYNDPSNHLKVIGITGTNGKTSCSHFIAQALQLEDKPCGIIGTLGNGLYGQLQHTDLTTPDAITLQKLFAEFQTNGTKYVAMEVASHGLVQGRVSGTHFNIAVFTNLTRDHLDYHGSIANYAAAKRTLFTQPGLGCAVLNADDKYGAEWLTELKPILPVYSYSLNPPLPQQQELNGIAKTYVHHAQLDSSGITASIHTPWGDGVLHNPHLTGRFNLSNLLAVVTVLGILGLSLEVILARMAQLRGVPGRMETFGGGNKPLVIVDFAHTPDALEQVLKALGEYKQGLLWCVFGCGGDRDRGKRPLMAKVAEQYADRLIITDDNPRQEDPKQIVAEIYAGLTDPGKAVIEHDRRRAIAHAISCAQADDVILIAGKGHETYQIIGKEKEPFNDALEVQKLLTEI